MRYSWLACCALCVTAMGCVRGGSQSTDGPQSPKPTVKSQPVSGTPYKNFVISEPVRHRNLQIFPVCSKAPKTADRFITLDEGLRSGTVEIIEVGGSFEDDELARTDATSEADYERTVAIHAADNEVHEDLAHASAAPHRDNIASPPSDDLIFESTPLSMKLWPKLLRGFALDALSAAEDSAGDEPGCDVPSCIAFLTAAETAKESKVEIGDNLTIRRMESDSIITFSASDTQSPQETFFLGGLGGGLGGVHAAAFKKKTSD